MSSQERQTAQFSNEQYMNDRQGSELSYGEKAVGINFNPGQNEDVFSIKRNYANIIDLLNWKREASTNPEVKRQLSVAITEAQTSQMWAVKAITWQY
jgi:hypothetical protein